MANGSSVGLASRGKLDLVRSGMSGALPAFGVGMFSPPLGAGVFSTPPIAPPSIAGGGGVHFGDLNIGPIIAPPGSDPGGIDYQALSVALAEQIRDALAGAGLPPTLS